MSIHTDGETLWLENHGFGLPEVEKLETLFHANRDLTTIHLRNIDGGNHIAEKVLFTKFANKRIEVHGRCLSMCSILALTGDPLVLSPDAVLAFHGFHGPDGTLNEELSLTFLNWLSSRLRTVPREALRTALTFPRKDDQGLLVRPANDGSGLIAVDLCERLPDQCKRVRYIGPGESRMTLADPTATSSKPTTLRAAP